MANSSKNLNATQVVSVSEEEYNNKAKEGNNRVKETLMLWKVLQSATNASGRFVTSTLDAINGKSDKEQSREIDQTSVYDLPFGSFDDHAPKLANLVRKLGGIS